MHCIVPISIYLVIAGAMSMKQKLDEGHLTTITFNLLAS